MLPEYCLPKLDSMNQNRSLVVYELYWTILSRNINLVATKQVTYDNSLVAPKKRLKIEKCNEIITFSKPQREETYQNTIQKVKDTDTYWFKLDKKKLRVDTEVFRQILQICPRIHNQDFIAPPSEEELVTFIQELGYFGRDTPRESVPKKKTLDKVDRGKCMDILSDATILKAAQVKEALQKRKKDSYMLHACGSGDGDGSQPKVPDVFKDKTTVTDEGVPDVVKYLSKSKNESWGDSGDDGSNDDDSDEVTKDDDEEDAESDANGDKEASDSKKTDSDDDENLNVNQNDDEEEDHEEEYSFEFNNDEEEYDVLYEEVDVKSLDAELEKEKKGDAEMMDGDKNVSQEISYEQVVDDSHVTLTTAQKTKGSMQSSFVSSDFASRFINLDNVPPVDNEVSSMMNVKVRHEGLNTFAPPLLTVHVTAIPDTFTVAAKTVPPIIQSFSSIL
nr:hypothetical protein [Tanacetum cinerariifolium]